MADITIGQYYPEKSIVHQLDPRVKLFGTMVFIIALFMANNLMAYTFITVVLFVVIKLAKIPFMKLMKGIRGILFILIVSAAFNLFFTTEGKVFVHAGIITITSGGIIKASYIAVRLIYLIIGTSIMTLATKPSDMADALEKSFSFLKVVKFPVHEMAMMMSLALRFIPTLMEETDKIMKAQKARGADFESGNLIQKIKNFLPLLIPLFVSAINRAFELAIAMETRCYNGGNRTKLKPLEYNRRDRMTYVIYLGFFLIIAATNLLAIVVQPLSVLRFIY